VAAGLRQGGVHPGDRVALWLPNGTDYLAAIFACARLGRLLSISNTRFRMAEVGSLLRRSRAVAMVTEWGLNEAALRARCLQQLARFKVPERIVVVETFPIVDSPNGAKVQRIRLREMAEALLREQRHNQPGDNPVGLPQR
jgi:acyl-CoA synthetase (AMP-forming)/AMP-acid ligase II